MKNQDVLINFINQKNGRTPKRTINSDYYKWVGHTLTSENGELINYKTVIARHNNGIVEVTTNYYSRTTSVIKNQLINLLNKYDIDFKEITF